MRSFSLYGKYLVATSLLPGIAAAHHSVSAWFDRASTTELAGEIVEIFWENPHVKFTLNVANADGDIEAWDIETLSVSGISRWGIANEMMAVGDRVLVAGNPSRRNLNNVFIRNILLPNGEEIVFGGEARWTEADRVLRASEVQQAAEGSTADTGQGIFRVWSTGSNDSILLFPEAIIPNFDFSVYPLTEAAAAALADFDIYEDDPTKDCTPKGMPTIMEQPYPMQFVDQDDRILMHIEEYDTRRTIYLRSDARTQDQAPSPLGFSTGVWDDGELVVTTSRVNWGHFDSVGIPLSWDAHFVERFSLAEDGSRLVYTIIVTDPATFTEPVALGKEFIWLPEATVEVFRCVDSD